MFFKIDMTELIIKTINNYNNVKQLIIIMMHKDNNIAK